MKTTKILTIAVAAFAAMNLAALAEALVCTGQQVYLSNAGHGQITTLAVPSSPTIAVFTDNGGLGQSGMSQRTGVLRQEVRDNLHGQPIVMTRIVEQP